MHAGAIWESGLPPGRLPADPDVLRTINVHADHCLGVYANVAKAGVLAEGDLLEFEPAGAVRAPAAVAGTGTPVLKRGGCGWSTH